MDAAHVSPLRPGSSPPTFSSLISSPLAVPAFLRLESTQKFEQSRVDLLGPLKLDPVTGSLEEERVLEAWGKVPQVRERVACAREVEDVVAITFASCA